MKASYHNHTPLCHHASGTPEEYVRAAIDGHYDLFGFSDHTPHLFDGDFVSGSRMRFEELRGYCDTIVELREKYADRIQLKIGLEVEYYPDLWERDLQAYADYPLDYLILGQHGIGSSESHSDWVNIFEATEDNRVLTQFVDQATIALETGLFSIVAHPDVLNFRGDPVFYRKEMNRFLQAIRRSGAAMEVNMYGIADGRHYPNPVFWQEARNYSIPVLLGRDAHKISRVDPIEEYPAAEEFLRSNGIRTVETVSLICPNR